MISLEKTGTYCLDWAPELRTTHNIKRPNNAYENLTNFTLFNTTVFKRNCIQEEIKRLIRCSRGLRRGSKLSSAHRTCGSWVRVSLGTRTYASDLSLFLSCGGRSLGMGRFLVQGALALSITVMVSEMQNWDRPDSLMHRKLKKKEEEELSSESLSSTTLLSTLTIEVYKAV